MNNIWQLQEAKNKFSHLVLKAREEGPQIVTKHGKEAVVVIDFEEYKKMIKPKENLVTFFQKSPLRQLKIKRNMDLPRDVEL